MTPVQIHKKTEYSTISKEDLDRATLALYKGNALKTWIDACDYGVAGRADECKGCKHSIARYDDDCTAMHDVITSGKCLYIESRSRDIIGETLNALQEVFNLDDTTIEHLRTGVLQ